MIILKLNLVIVENAWFPQSLTSAYDNTKTKFSDCGKCMVSVKECEKLINKYK
jgi:hypothetical protein